MSHHSTQLRDYYYCYYFYYYYFLPKWFFSSLSPCTDSSFVWASVVSHLVMYRAKVLMYHRRVLLACLKKVCRKPPINVPYKHTFGAPDQGQMLDVWERQTTESALRWRMRHIVPRHNVGYILVCGLWTAYVAEWLDQCLKWLRSGVKFPWNSKAGVGASCQSR
jgi:hypothetical protein